MFTRSQILLHLAISIQLNVSPLLFISMKITLSRGTYIFEFKYYCFNIGTIIWEIPSLPLTVLPARIPCRTGSIPCLPPAAQTV